MHPPPPPPPQVPAPRDALLHQTEIVLYLLDLFHDQNGAIRLWASKCLDAVAEADEDWAAQIRQRKFAMHNHEWLEVVDEDEVGWGVEGGVVQTQVGGGGESTRSGCSRHCAAAAPSHTHPARNHTYTRIAPPRTACTHTLIPQAALPHPLSRDC